MRQLVLDTETTGLSVAAGDRVIEIGCVEIIDRKITGGEYHRLINPRRNIPQGAVNIHGITGKQLLDKPIFSEIASEFLEYIKGAELVIHNAPFDIGFLNMELGLLAQEQPKITDLCTVVDTLALARSLHPRQHTGLDALCKLYHVDNSHRTVHGALLDSKLLAEVYLLMTGGQTSFLDQLDTTITDEAAASQTKARHLQIDRGSIKVIKATSDELQAHQKWLQLLQQQAPEGCLWQELEE